MIAVENRSPNLSYYFRNREREMAQHREWRTAHPEWDHEYNSRPDRIARVAERKALARAIMDGELARGCIDCGVVDFDILEFDHRPGQKKKWNVTCMNTSSPKAIYAEIDKCDVRCANCHRKITAVRRRAASGK